MRGLEERNRSENTVIVLTASHGEEFLDHGYVGHGWTLYDEVLHVPLIIRAPNVLQVARIDARVSSVDILPTLLNLFGVDHARADFDGEPYLAAEGNTFVFRPPKKPQIAELVIRERCILRAVVEDDWKYVAAQSWHPPAERYAVASSYDKVVADMRSGTVGTPPLWGNTVREELYRLAEDPQEQRDLAAESEEKVRQLQEVLAAYQRYCRQHGLEAREATEKLELPEPAQLEELEAIGYL